MGSCSNKGTQTKNGIQEVVVYTNPSETNKNGNQLKENPTLENPEKPIKPQNPSNPGQDLVRRQQNQEKDKQPLKFFFKIPKQSTGAEAPNAEITNPIKSSEEREFIEKVLKKIMIFSKLSSSQIQILIDQMLLFSLKGNETVFVQNSPGRYFFIVAKGKLSMKILGFSVNVLTVGMSIGESALLQNAPRTATVETIEDSFLWALDRDCFSRLVSGVNSADYQENKQFIENTEVFKNLTASQIEALIPEISFFKFEPGAAIIREGDTGKFLYIIKEGTATCVKGGNEVGKLVKGDCFGEQALFFDVPRSATVIADEPVTCIGVRSKTLTKVFGAKLQDLIYKNMIRHVVKNNQFLKKLSKIQEEVIVQSMDLVTFQDNDIVIPAGTAKNKDLIIIIKGSLLFTGREINHMSLINDKEIIQNSNETWTTDVKSKGKTIIACISKSNFENAIGGKYEENVGNNNRIKMLKNVPLLRNLGNDQLSEIIHVMRVEEFGDGVEIVREKDPGDSLFIIKSGKVEITKGGVYMRTVSKNDYFGERALLFSAPRSATVIACGRVIVFVIFREDFLRIINDKIKFNLIKRIDLQDESIQLKDLKIVKLLGKGLTGVVFLTVHQKKKTLYALKTVHKQKIFEYNMHKSIVLEREILLQLDHVFIMKLVKTFKDAKRIYFLTEYVRGMDLFEVIRKMNFISEPHCRFFVGSLLLVLEDLHEKSLVYRDLKPENVVVDDEGYLKVIDFGTAKFVNGKTYTVLGTPQYMAPEVILSIGYNWTADYWSLGVMMFEFLFGYVPFGEEDVDPMVVYEKVLARKIDYPNIGESVYVQSKALIEQLLSKNPALRDAGSVECIKGHPWFKGFEWQMLVSRQMNTPYLPKVSRCDKEIENVLNQTQNFDLIIEEQETFKGMPDEEEPGWDKEF
jgi:cGMP-dependent protein kinase